MSRMSWILSAVTLAVLLNQGKASAQDAKAAAAPTVATAAPAIYMDPGSDTSSRQGVGLIADVGFMILRPAWKTNPAFFTFESGGSGTNLTEHDFNFGEQFVPEISLGYMGSNGLGFRTSWWGFALSSAENATG